MRYVYLFGLMLLACSKVTVQSLLARKIIKNTTDVTFYNMMVFFFVGAVYIIMSGLQMPAPTTLICGTIFGAFTAVFQLSYTAALKSGPVSITVLIGNFSIAVTTVFGLVYYHEKLSALNIVGFVLLAASLLLSVNVAEIHDHKFNFKWFILAITYMLALGISNIVMKLHTGLAGSESNNSFLAVAYPVGGILLTFFWLGHRKAEPQTIPIKLTSILPLFSVGIILCLHGPINMYTMTLFNASIFFPVTNVGTSVLVSFVGVLVFKDRLRLPQYIGIVLGIASVVLLSL